MERLLIVCAQSAEPGSDERIRRYPQIKYHGSRASAQTETSEKIIVSMTSKAAAFLKFAALASASSITFTVFAADAAKVENLRVTNACKYCDLTDAALTGMDLRGADFQNANLAGANLSNTDLSQRPMEKRTLSTNFESANLKKTNLSGAKLNGANFLNAFLRETNLQGADLTGASFTSANLKGANLKGAKLDGVKLDDAKLCNTVMPDGSVNDSGC